MSGRARTQIRVEGIVQGVGFRPFVHGLATELGLGGLVGNDVRGVFIEVEGDPGAIETFLAALRHRPPPLAVVEQVDANGMPATGQTEFTIVASQGNGARRTLISPDTATCADCLRDMADPADRRFGYAFTNCTNCGPRFTIIRDVPYDRPNTTMASFAMCADCAREYHDPADRRFHAQPVCCPACGPRLTVRNVAGHEVAGDPLAETVRLLRAGAVVAVKGLGGYHLATAADCEPAVAALRSRKHREDKPFAVMVDDLAAAERLCVVDEVAARVLSSPRRPIVLLPRHPDAPVAPSVAPGNRFLGLMLPYTPLHHLLVDRLAAPLVLTSGNVSDEPIAYVDTEAFDRLSGIADYVLTHDRAIHIRTDDSVIRVFRGHELPVRRSRGFVPQPVPLRSQLPRPVLACGSELKNTFCLASGRHAFVSHHIGDLENYETLRSFTEGIEHFQRLFDIAPEVVAYDLHPEYLSTKYALELSDVDLVGVQHHHAHIASCLADNGETGPVIGVAFDGLGYGLDGTIWGGELLIASLTGFTRAGHLATVPMPGGTAAIKQPWRMAAAYLDAAYAGDVPAGLTVVARNAAQWDGVVSLARREVNAPQTSSMGRLFDAVATIVGARDTINYEGQAAVELEQRADLTERGTYEIPLSDSAVADGFSVVHSVAEDLLAGTRPEVIAARFHNAVAGLVVAAAVRLRETSGLSTVALSGGVFQNLLLLERSIDLLAENGFRVLTHSRVPPNDGGISLGQAAIAAAT